MDFTVKTVPGMPNVAVVAAPSTHLVVGLERLQQLRGRIEQGRVDEVIQAELLAHANADVFILRGRNDDGTGSWTIDPGLDDESARELGYLLIRSQLLTYRALVHHGVLGHFHTDWGGRECNVLANGMEQLAGELRRSNPKEPPPEVELDIWILEHLTFFLFAPLDEVLTTFLPRVLPQLEHRRERLRRLLAPGQQRGG